MTKKTDLNRRRFLQKLAVVAGGTSLMAYKGKLDLVQSALASTSALPGGPKSLVCLFMFGGNDAFNMFLPYDQPRYDEYAQSRQNLALAYETLVPATNGDDYAFHPSLAALRDLYDQNKLGVVSNLGNLLTPVTRAEYLNGTAPLPAGLFSHSHQQEVFQTNLAPAASVANPGWGGLMADLLKDGNSNPAVPLSFSTYGDNLWEAGETTQPFGLDPSNGAESFDYLDSGNWPPNEVGRSAAWTSMLNLSRDSSLASEMSDTFSGTLERVALIQDALSLTDPEEGGITIATPYNTGNNLAVQLRMIARMIYARSHLGQERQIFFAGIGGWDTHGTQLASHDARYAILADALASFQGTLGEFGMEDSVVTFSASEFGRTLTSNGDGTDHGWGSHALVLGGTGAVLGGNLYGDFPSMVLGSENDSGSNGRLIPNIAVDQYGATLAKWMGLTPSQVADIFPNLGNFNTDDLGFLV